MPVPGATRPGGGRAGTGHPGGRRSGSRHDRWRADDRGPPDLRLAALAVATWLSAYGALHTTAAVALVAAVAALAVTAVAWRRVGRSGAWAGVAVALLLGLVCGAAAAGARVAVRDAAPVAEAAAARARVTVEATVRRTPHRLGPPSGRATWLVPMWLHRLDAPSGPVHVRVRLLVFADDPGWQAVLPGQRLAARGTLAPPRGGDLTAAVLSVDGPPEPQDEPPWWQRTAGALRAGLLTATAPLPDEPGGLLPGLAVGDVSELDPGVAEDFFTTGMTHLVSVSGPTVSHPYR